MTIARLAMSTFGVLNIYKHAQNTWILREANKSFPLPGKSAIKKAGGWTSSVNESYTAKSLKPRLPFQKRSIMHS